MYFLIFINYVRMYSFLLQKKFHFISFHCFIFFFMGINVPTVGKQADNYLLIPKIHNLIFDGMPDEPEWSFSTRTTTSGSIALKTSFESLTQDFKLSDNAFVPVGNYSFYRLAASYRMPLEKLFNVGATLEGGTFYDGTRFSLLFKSVWYVSKHLELSAEYLYERVRFDERNQKFDAHIARIRIGTAINNKISTNGLVQFNSTLELVSANIRFRYNFREGNDLWIVYNEGLNTSLNHYTPELPLSDTRTVLIKYTHTIHL